MKGWFRLPPPFFPSRADSSELAGSEICFRGCASCVCGVSRGRGCGQTGEQGRPQRDQAILLFSEGACFLLACSILAVGEKCRDRNREAEERPPRNISMRKTEQKRKRAGRTQTKRKRKKHCSTTHFAQDRSSWCQDWDVPPSYRSARTRSFRGIRWAFAVYILLDNPGSIKR